MNPPVLLVLYWERKLDNFQKIQISNKRLDVRDTNNCSSRNLKPEQINLF